jgi:hypothetical protein
MEPDDGWRTQRVQVSWHAGFAGTCVRTLANGDMALERTRQITRMHDTTTGLIR